MQVPDGLFNWIMSCTCRPHPYIFFNKDRVSATFVGFTVTPSGDLWDPRNPNFLRRQFVPTELLDTMKKLRFNEDYQKWYNKST